MRVMSQLVNAVLALHTANPPFAHLDLKLENVFLQPPDHWVVADFGSARRHVHVQVTTPQEAIELTSQFEEVTTPPYRPPEYIQVQPGMCMDLRTGDIWALGVVLFSMACGEFPFEGPLGATTGNFTIPSWANSTYSAELIFLVRWMLTVNFSERPTIDQVSSFLQSCWDRSTGSRCINATLDTLGLRELVEQVEGAREAALLKLQQPGRRRGRGRGRTRARYQRRRGRAATPTQASPSPKPPANLPEDPFTPAGVGLATSLSQPRTMHKVTVTVDEPTAPGPPSPLVSGPSHGLLSVLADAGLLAGPSDGDYLLSDAAGAVSSLAFSEAQTPSPFEPQRPARLGSGSSGQLLVASTPSRSAAGGPSGGDPFMDQAQTAPIVSGGELLTDLFSDTETQPLRGPTTDMAAAGGPSGGDPFMDQAQTAPIVSGGELLTDLFSDTATQPLRGPTTDMAAAGGPSGGDPFMDQAQTAPIVSGGELLTDPFSGTETQPLPIPTTDMAAAGGPSGGDPFMDQAQTAPIVSGGELLTDLFSDTATQPLRGPTTDMAAAGGPSGGDPFMDQAQTAPIVSGGELLTDLFSDTETQPLRGPTTDMAAAGGPSGGDPFMDQAQTAPIVSGGELLTDSFSGPEAQPPPIDPFHVGPPLPPKRRSSIMLKQHSRTRLVVGGSELLADPFSGPIVRLPPIDPFSANPPIPPKRRSSIMLKQHPRTRLVVGGSEQSTDPVGSTAFRPPPTNLHRDAPSSSKGREFSTGLRKPATMRSVQARQARYLRRRRRLRGTRPRLGRGPPPISQHPSLGSGTEAPKPGVPEVPGKPATTQQAVEALWGAPQIGAPGDQPVPSQDKLPHADDPFLDDSDPVLRPLSAPRTGRFRETYPGGDVFGTQGLSRDGFVGGDSLDSLGGPEGDVDFDSIFSERTPGFAERYGLFVRWPQLQGLRVRAEHLRARLWRG